MIRNDDRTDIYAGIRRIGYILDGRLYVIGLDGFATPLCDVSNDAAAIDAVRTHHYAGIR